MDIKDLKVGMTVYWEDPDDGLASENKTITEIDRDNGVVTLDGGTEAYAWELHHAKV